MLNKMKEALGEIDKSQDPTVGAGMNMDDLVNKLLEENREQNPDFEKGFESLPQEEDETRFKPKDPEETSK